MFQLAVIGHQKFYAETLRGISEDDLKKHVKIVCVNEKKPKDIPMEFPKEIVTNEWDIPDYEPFYQQNNYYQNSFFFNLMNIVNTIDADQLGFFQYDMIITPEIFEKIKIMCESDKEASIGFYPYPIEHLFEVVKPGQWQFIIQQYSNFFQIPINDSEIEKLENMKLPLFHTFVIPRGNYCRMMHFAKKVLQNLLTFLGNDTRHIAGTLERLFALFLNLEIITNNMKEFTWIDGLVHDDKNLRLRDDFRGIS